MANYNILREAEVYLATNEDVESGLTVSETLAPNTSVSNVGAFSGANDRSKVLMAGEVVLPSSFSNDHEVLGEHGGTGYGYWIGITTIDSVKNLLLRVGTGTVGSTETNDDRIYKTIPLSSIPEFDDKRHTVCWEFDPPNGTAKMWIDNRLILSEITTDGTFLEWTGGNEGGWLEGFSTIAGQGNVATYRTAWSGGRASDLRIYTNQARSYGNIPVRLDVTPELDFNQTFTDKTYSQKTLHDKHKMHDASNITKANPANFEFTMPAITQNDLQVVVDLLRDFDSTGHNLKSFVLYTKLKNDAYLLEKCVMTNGTFIIEKLENLKLAVSGQASRLSRGVEVPTIVTARSGTTTFQQTKYLDISIDGSTLSEGVFNVSVELQNDVKWDPYETVHAALDVTNAGNSMYPSNFTLKKRSLSGSIGQYITDTANSDVQTWDKDVAITIKAGESATSGFQFYLDSCTFTNRNEFGEVFTQNYDWKSNDNPTDLGATTGTRIEYNDNN